MNLEDYMLPCLNKALLGVECTGCGGQRALLFLFQGEFIKAFYMYPPIYLIIILFAFLIFEYFYKFKNSYKMKIGLIVLTGSIMLISYVLKITLLHH